MTRVASPFTVALLGAALAVVIESAPAAAAAGPGYGNGGTFPAPVRNVPISASGHPNRCLSAASNTTFGPTNLLSLATCDRHDARQRWNVLTNDVLQLSGTEHCIAQAGRGATGGAGEDPDPSNDTATNTLSVSSTVTVDVAMTGDGAPVDPGDDLTYRVTVTNEGASDVPGVTVTDLVPASVETVTWTCTSSGDAACGTAP